MGERPVPPFKMLGETWQSSRPAEFRAIVGVPLRCDRRAHNRHQSWGREALRTRLVWWSALPMLLPVPVLAQTPATPPAPAQAPAPDEIVAFSADQVVYDSDADIVTASGEVRMNRDGNYLAADQVVWDRKSDRKSTRLNSSHRCISYAVFCLKKKKMGEDAHPPRRQIPGRAGPEPLPP